jgi:hypothetical protein
MMAGPTNWLINLNRKIMKKNIRFVISLLLIFALAGCRYADFMADYTYTSVYFPKLTNTRTFVVGEIHTIELGVVLGGKRSNSVDEWVDFQIDPSLVPSGSTLLPANYYKLSNSSRFTIPVGSLQGAIAITIDTAKFINDPLALQAKYVLPFRLLKTSADSILPRQNTHVLSLKYEHRLFGNYYHNGVTTTTTASGTVTTIIYHQEEPVTNAINNWILTTVGSYTLKTSGVLNLKDGVNNTFNITVPNNNSVVVSKNPGSLYNVVPSGPCSYNASKKEFYLQYSYTNAGNTYKAIDTLIFRNRILDGVNQWR